CSVLTRPPSISGDCVSCSTAVTGSPASRSARSVPPLATKSQPSSTSARPNSTKPVLLYTLNRARGIPFLSLCSVRNDFHQLGGERFRAARRVAHVCRSVQQ